MIPVNQNNAFQNLFVHKITQINYIQHTWKERMSQKMSE